MEVIEQLLVPSSLGVIGFLVTQYLLKPYEKFWELRERVNVALIYFSNVWVEQNDNVQKSGDEIRRLACEFTAFSNKLNQRVFEYCFAKMIITKLFKMDVKKAAEQLMVYQNDLLDQSGVRTNATREIEKALKLPETVTERQASNARVKK